jgi:hypothetical protein
MVKQLCIPLSFMTVLFFVLTANAQGPILGMNASMGSLPIDQQNAILSDLHAAGVRYIRAGITPDDHGIDLARRAQAQGIGILWIVQLQYRPEAPSRPWPNAYNVWGGPPLSAADPGRFRNYFQPIITRLEAAGITLAGFELGNEINSPMFNADFSLPAETPGQSKEFNLPDLYNDPEGQQVAKGYLQYLKLLAVIKDVRAHSRLNRHTPIISAGLVFNEAPDAPRGKNIKLDAVSATATIAFLRANGLDTLVDAYGVHTYPWVDGPGVPSAVAGRRDRLANYVLAPCQPEGSTSGKPCWITEWGIPNHDTLCPVHETSQITLVRETRANFQPYLHQRRVLALFYYAWLDTREFYGVFRCGKCTETGRLAVAP